MMQLTRKGLLAATLALVALLSACANGTASRGAARIDARVDATLDAMYRNYPNTRELADKAAGMLVMPVITEAGFGLGGAYGRGALRVNGRTVDYYSATRANIGLQIGAQQYTHVLFFMTRDALEDFRRSDGWALGANAEYAVPDAGGTLKIETTDLLSPVIVVIFGHSGLRVGATLEGTKYTRIIP